jgi:hypothetical protein
MPRIDYAMMGVGWASEFSEEHGASCKRLPNFLERNVPVAIRLFMDGQSGASADKAERRHEQDRIRKQAVPGRQRADCL